MPSPTEPLHASLVYPLLTIRVGVQTLARAVEDGPLYDLARVTNPKKLAQLVANHLNASGDAMAPIIDALDKAIFHVFEQGEDCIEELPGSHDGH